MKEMPTDDPLFGKGTIRDDGRKIHPAYLVEVKKPVGVEGPVGLLQAPRDDPGRPGVPAAERRRLPAGQVTQCRDGPTRHGDRFSVREPRGLPPCVEFASSGTRIAGANRASVSRTGITSALRR